MTCATGCSISSTSMSSGLGNNLSLPQDTPSLATTLPTDTSKANVAIFLGSVECNALVTGRPLELARHVRISLAQHLASSGNFAVVETTRAARFLIEVKISSFERGIKTQSAAHTTDVVLESSRAEERRRGILELQIAVTDPLGGKLIHSFSTASQAEDTTSTKSSGLLGFTSVGVNYERRPDAEVISEATGKAALELWRRLVSSTGPLSNLNP